MDDATPPLPPAPAGSSPPKGLVERVAGILTSPKNEWGVIEGEASNVQSIYTSYVMILAAIPPVALLLGQQLIGISFGGITVKPSIGYSVVSAILQYGLSLAAVYILALVIDALAPTFKGQKSLLNAFKVAAYSMTPGWLAGILFIVPILGLLSFIGAIYGFYLLYLGLPRLMKVKEDQALGYVGVSIFVNFLVMVIAFVIVRAISGALFPLVYTVPNVVIYS